MDYSDDIHNEWQSILANAKKSQGAESAIIENLAANLDFLLPNDYLVFLAEMNGCEGLVGTTYLNLWRAEDLVELNEKYRTAEFAPGYFIFGSNLGGSAFAFKKEDGQIVSFEFISMLIDDEPRILAASFNKFLESLK